MNVHKFKEVSVTERHNPFLVILIVVKIDRIVGCQQGANLYLIGKLDL
jgi:hypothetical protein